MATRLAFAALILSSHDNRLIGNAVVWTDIYPTPASAEDIKRIGALMTEWAHRDGDLPNGQHYLVTGWSVPGEQGGA